MAKLIFDVLDVLVCRFIGSSRNDRFLVVAALLIQRETNLGCKRVF